MGHVARIGSVKRRGLRQRGASSAESASRQKRTVSTTHAPQSIRIQRKITGGTVHRLLFMHPGAEKICFGVLFFRWGLGQGFGDGYGIRRRSSISVGARIARPST